jgi:hypothetical protein
MVLESAEHPRSRVRSQASPLEVAFRMISFAALVVAAAASAATQDSSGTSAEPAPPATPSPAVELVAKAYGGREALAAFPGFHARGKILSIVDGLGGTWDTKVLLDGSLRAELQYPQRAEVRILSGALAWNGGRRKQSVSSRSMKDAILLQYHRLAAPFEIAAASTAELSEDGRSEEGWIRLRREWGPSLSMVYEVDPDTGFVRRTTGRAGSGEAALELVTEMEDFRTIESSSGAILFPFRTVTIIGGEVVSETTLERMEEKSDFTPQTFLPAGAEGDF